MDEDVEENYEEDHPDSENDLRFSEGHEDVSLEEEIEYDSDYEKYSNEDGEEHGEDEDEFEEDERKEGDSKIDVASIESRGSRRKSIYMLDSYASSSIIPTLKTENVGELTEIPESPIRYSESIGFSGIARLDLSPLTQKIIGCVVDENVTTEYPWIYVKKELIEDNLDLHSESSDFLTVKDEIENFPDTKILIGYAPSSKIDGQFYVCLTEAGRDAVVRQIEIQRLEQENRVRSAILKAPGKWSDCGSEAEVDESIVKNNRPLLEIEIETPEHLTNKEVDLVTRDVDDQRDGYVKLTPYRETFETILKPFIDTGCQNGSTYRENKTQTIIIPENSAWMQHSCDYCSTDLSKWNETKKEELKEFLQVQAEKVCSKVQMNATWNIHTNDYEKLMRPEKNSESITIPYTEHQSYYEGKLCMNKVINNLSWHPLWTGILLCTYTNYAKSVKFTGPKHFYETGNVIEGKNQTLLWSLNDNLLPKISCYSPREVSVASICPYDGDIIVGGCTNGQIAVWHFPGKIEKMETIEVQTAAQVRNRIAVKSLMTWMRDSVDLLESEVTAMSPLQWSQKGRITQISWVPCYNKVQKDGEIINLPEDTDPSDLSYQFLTSSEDGTVAVWDLKWQPLMKKRKLPGARGEQQKVKRPDALLKLISPYKELDGAIIPDYIIVAAHPENGRPVMITTMNVYFPPIEKEQIQTKHVEENNDITVRKHYRNIFKKPTYEMKPKIFIGTVEGQCGSMAWEGFSFRTGQTVNREPCKWNWLNIIHDGPVTETARSPFISDVIMSIGGRIFALWEENFHRCFFWNKSNHRYTACSWGNYRPSVFVVSRADGTIEVWNFTTKSDKASLEQSISGELISGISNHELPLDPQCIAFCDFNGAFRIFLSPPLIPDYEKNIQWMKNFINRTVNGMERYEAWQKHWSESNLESIEQKRKMAEMDREKRIKEAEEKIKAEMQEAASEVDKTAKTEVSKDFFEIARLRWMSMELKRMQHAILEKKGLNEEELERRRIPAIKMDQETKLKENKLKKIIQLQDKIFEDTTALLFPDQYYEEQQRIAQFLLDREEKSAPILKHRTSEEIQFSSSEEEIIYNFMEVQAEVLASMRRRPHKQAFQWRQALSEGRAWRDTMDIELKKCNKRRKRNRVTGNDVSDMAQSISLPTLYSSSESDQSTEVWSSISYDSTLETDFD